MRVFLEVGDLRKQTGNEKEFTGRASRLEIELQGDLIAFSDVQVSGWAKNVGGKIYVRGSITAGASLTCSRCLAPFSVLIEPSFEETYFGDGGAGSRDLGDAGRIYRGERIDLSDVIIESLILTLPMKSVCRTACRGLCTTCGCNLNTERCGCGPKAPDPRLAVLGEYLENIKNE